ncbi:ATP-dependent Clp protease, protease subunit [Thermoflavifilum thermophilum]|uniref:ATP-dependent Clp protease proteolytic subunit n=2 Tax=Thermoflavifilum thermophilum TaxID=1393122 RepID=A0A1I7N429_9BACT|nr:ATP-dependent Clp protease, protease subunit [Thermoflavifilum thermophilum]
MNMSTNMHDEFRRYAVHHRRINSLALDQYTRHTIKALTPYIIEERPLNVASMDVFSRLMMDRIIFLGEPIDDYVANIVTAQLLFLESTDRGRDIQMYINSPGGSAYAGLGIYDTMQVIQPDVATICTGIAASMAAVLMCAGVKGKRTALKHSRILIHQPSGGISGQASDVEITAREISRVKRELYEIIAYHSGQSVEKIERDGDRDFWMSAEEAVAYGLIDEVLQTHPRKKPTEISSNSKSNGQETQDKKNKS